jgi:hypothetical protein
MKFLLSLLLSLLYIIQSKNTFKDPPCKVYKIFTVTLEDIQYTSLEMCFISAQSPKLDHTIFFEFYIELDNIEETGFGKKIRNNDNLIYNNLHKDALFYQIKDNQFLMRLDLTYLILTMPEANKIYFEYIDKITKTNYRFSLTATEGNEQMLYPWFDRYACRSIKLKQRTFSNLLINQQTIAKQMANELYHNHHDRLENAKKKQLSLLYKLPKHLSTQIKTPRRTKSKGTKQKGRKTFDFSDNIENQNKQTEVPLTVNNNGVNGTRSVKEVVPVWMKDKTRTNIENDIGVTPVGETYKE